MKVSLLGAALFLVFAPALAAEIDPAAGCKNNPAVVAACFSLRGRIAAYNGTPSLRIWPVGFARLLGVVPAENEIVPANLRGQVSFEHSAYANLVVCPFTQPTPGAMQLVCIESASNVEVRSSQVAPLGRAKKRREPVSFAVRQMWTPNT